MTPNKLVTNIMTTKDSGNENSTMSDSTTKVLSIHDEPPRELAISQFAAFRTSIEQIRETMITNLGDATIGITDLEQIKIPAGGGTLWTLPGPGGEQLVPDFSGVILIWREMRKRWKLPLEQSDGPMPPDCYSPDTKRGI